MKRYYNIHFTFQHSFITATVVSERELTEEEIISQAEASIALDGFDVTNAQSVEQYEMEGV